MLKSVVGDRGRTSFREALDTCNSETICGRCEDSTLLSRSPDSRGNTPLYCAIDAGNGEIVEQLLQAGVNVNAPSTGGLTPLMKATIEGHIEIVRALLDSEADY
jgi:hypothetical protein